MHSVIHLVLASHGRFAEGMKDSIQMIFGSTKNLHYLVFYPDESPEDFRRKVEVLTKSFEENSKIVFLTDIKGGTPYNQIEQFKETVDLPIEIISGINLPTVLQCYSAVLSGETDLAIIVNKGVIEGEKSLQSTVDRRSDCQETEISSEGDIKEAFGITHVRLDERLIHGQIATLWVGYLKVNRIMVIDDDIVKNEVAKSSLKSAVPSGVKLSILTVKNAAKRIKEKVYSGQKVLVILKNIDTLFKLLECGAPIQEINLGNASPKDNTVSINKSLFLPQDAIDKLLSLEKSGFRVTVQMVPMDEKKFLNYK
ncbi:PTS mannose/fructose/sorbose transporter subunit IIAB [Atopobacter sp. AH10]|uniref:PTS mannose/fructose/sorbose transporter subunit IIAB n=1 Tax=Atopobacter sp. AH10 TaxID=2315861 RepID=UPI000EF2230C|nr:PTS mannose/fructose/sorbose transporter subunit IIAB [Atopobacter sp. AH10]RLK62838.1 PTS mannose/fructose/sorbose transporter subunit IIAB [Atopobacter sp. AH10]